MDYEKKYKEALEWMQSLYDGLHGATKEDAEHYFPELKESEDERIKREIIDFLRLPHHQFAGKRDHEKWIAWLEKQGEQKPDDNVAPKFKVGDWIVNNVCLPIQIASIKDSMYIFTKGDAMSVSFIDENFHLWTIQDAKDGDILVVNNEVFIYAHRKQMYSIAVAHCFVDSAGGFYLDGEFGYEENGKTISPATKKQYNLLFQKMKEAGYEWDSEKKELKQIEPKKLDADKVIAWLVANICDFEYYVKLFKKDFEL